MIEAHETIERIRSFYPDLVARREDHEDGGTFSIEYPAQPGLSFSISLVFYDDILQIEAGEFLAEYFPCQDLQVQERFVDAACGLIEGTYRIVYFRRGSRVLKAQLQAPCDDGWEAKATRYVGFWSFVPWLTTSEQAVQNVAAA